MNKLSIFLISSLLSFSAFADDINVYKEGVIFPTLAYLDRGAHFLRNGASGNESAINKMEIGLDKTQVKLLLGLPHFPTGLFGVHVWNYVFNFKDTNGSNVLCQYQVQFDGNMLVSGSYFSSKECANSY